MEPPLAQSSCPPEAGAADVAVLCDTSTSGAGRGPVHRKYTRDGLFRVAKSMKDESLIEEVTKFENRVTPQSYSSQPTTIPDGDAGDKLLLLSSSSSIHRPSSKSNSSHMFARQYSELSHDYASLNTATEHSHTQWFNSNDLAGATRYSANNNNNNSSSKPTKRISRMTSSPAINFTSSAHTAQFNSLSSQVRDRYAKLIETFAAPSMNEPASSAASFTAAASTRQGVSRTVSHNSWLSNGSAARSAGQRSAAAAVERPTHLFGPLRRELPPIPTTRQDQHQHHHSRRNSDEPLSLPYASVNSQARNHHSSGKRLATATGSNTTRLLMEDPFSSPIKRISSIDRPAAVSTTEASGGDRETSGGNIEGDEGDDFDITSLLSITVLSDIKTIRQDLQEGGSFRQSSNLSKQQTSFRGRNTNLQHESPAMRPLSRARTAHDFTHNGRQGFEIASQQQRQRNNYQPNSGYFMASSRGPGGASSSSSLASSYNWPNNQDNQSLYANRRDLQRQQQQQEPPSTQVNSDDKDKKPVDESVAQIIETFKAQVKARASAKADLISSESRQSSSGSNNGDGARSERPEAAAATVAVVQTNKMEKTGEPTTTSTRKKENEQETMSLEGLKKESAGSPQQGQQQQEEKGCSGKETDEQQQQLNQSAQEQQPRATAAAAASNVTSSEAQGGTQKRSIGGLSSNIPRLVSLYKTTPPSTSSPQSATVKKEGAGGVPASPGSSSKILSADTGVSKITGSKIGNKSSLK